MFHDIKHRVLVLAIIYEVQKYYIQQVLGGSLTTKLYKSTRTCIRRYWYICVNELLQQQQTAAVYYECEVRQWKITWEYTKNKITVIRHIIERRHYSHNRSTFFVTAVLLCIRTFFFLHRTTSIMSLYSIEQLSPVHGSCDCCCTKYRYHCCIYLVRRIIPGTE